MNKIAHIGIAVKNLDEMIPFYRDTLGLEFNGVEIVPSENVKVAFFKIGESAIELLEPTNEQSAIAKFIEKKGEGIHHVAFDVDDIHIEMEELKDQGIRLIQEKPKIGAGGALVAFIHPKAAGRVLYRVMCQKPKEDF